jgi:hypothetical protein
MHVATSAVVTLTGSPKAGKFLISVRHGGPPTRLAMTLPITARSAWGPQIPVSPYTFIGSKTGHITDCFTILRVTWQIMGISEGHQRRFERFCGNYGIML